MSGPTFFVQHCPTCGRVLEIRVEHLGKQVACTHCRAKFRAFQSEGAAPAQEDFHYTDGLMARVDDLLALMTVDAAEPLADSGHAIGKPRPFKAAVNIAS